MKDAVICGNNIDEKEYLKYIAKYSEYYNIVGIIDEKIDGNKIKRLADVPVLNMRLENVKLFFIVADKEWDIMSSRLLAIGKEKHKDFEVGWYLEHKDKNCMRYEYLTYNIKIDTNYVEERLSSCMTYINGTVHLALYLNALKEIPNVTIVYIPKEIAPKKTYLTAASGLKASYPVQILSNGEIRLNKTGNMDSIIMIDTMWHV